MLRLRHPVSLCLIAVLVLWGVLRSYSVPDPVASDVPDLMFSAVRAKAILNGLLPDGEPHVAGSAANARVRHRIVAQLEQAGYEPEFQSRYHCNPRFGSCSPVDNIIAVRKGSPGARAVLLTAHYDSVWAGPGGADNGSGVAIVLEIARMVANFPPFRNNIIFLLSDAEENGLVGADAFAEHHALFASIGAVINLEARGVTGPSGMFETGEGNRSLIRIYSKSTKRPVANSLIYEMYRRMPNDTDFSVYRDRGLTGFNFAFAGGAAAYHSSADVPAHLDPGSLQHQGDNAWNALQALADRDLRHLASREDAGFMDVFGRMLLHYPVSITGGLGVFLGVWVMLAIGLAFRREFRFRQLRWAFLAIPFLIALIFLSAYLLSWPLGRWTELHPLDHPYPWAGRVTLFLSVVLCLYVALKLFSGRVSACAWMILAWGLLVALSMILSARLPSGAHVGLLPLLLFALGSVVDLFRRKSPAPLLVASLAGFAAAALVSFYHFFMLEIVLNFDDSHTRTVPLIMVAVVVMPILLAWGNCREFDWQPARWLLVAVLGGCFVHLSLPPFTPERPRAMSLLYYGEAGEEKGFLILGSEYGVADEDYAKKHDFRPTPIELDGRGPRRYPARTITALDLPVTAITELGNRREGEGWRLTLRIDAPLVTPLLRLVLPAETGLQKAWVNGQLAFDTDLRGKPDRKRHVLQFVRAGPGPLLIEWLTASPDSFELKAVSRHPLPADVAGTFLRDWPPEASPVKHGHRALLVQRIRIGVDN